MFGQIGLAFEALGWGIRSYFKNFLDFLYVTIFVGLFAGLVIFIVGFLGDMAVTDILQTQLDEQLIKCVQGGCPPFMQLYETVKVLAANKNLILGFFAIISVLAFIFGLVLKLGFIKMGIQIFDKGKTSYLAALSTTDVQLFRASVWFLLIIFLSQYENIFQLNMEKWSYIIGFFALVALVARLYFYLPYVADFPRAGMVESIKRSIKGTSSCWLALIIITLIARAVFGLSDAYLVSDDSASGMMDAMKLARMGLFVLWPIIPLAVVYLYRTTQKKKVARVKKTVKKVVKKAVKKVVQKPAKKTAKRPARKTAKKRTATRRKKA